VLPAALRYQTELATNAAALTAVGIEFDRSTLEAVSSEVATLQSSLAALRDELGAEVEGGVLDEARFSCDVLIPAMSAVRASADLLEAMVADDLWPLATYQEMLFIL